MAELQVRVLRRKAEAEGIASFELARADGGPLPAFSAGSHIDVHVPGGLTRQYSLCNDALTHNTYRIAVLRDAKSRGGSQAMHDRVREGDLLTISEPRNHFPLVHAVRTLLFAGGIGITPLLCMAHRLASVGSEFELHYSSRSKERTAFMDEIAASAFAARVHYHFDDGPEQDTSADRAFDVKLASSGQVIRVAPHQTVVRALAAHGVEVLTSCEQGVCGTCITRVLEGECDHRDLYFTDEEKAKHDQFTPCCSRAKGAVLVLDL